MVSAYRSSFTERPTVHPGSFVTHRHDSSDCHRTTTALSSGAVAPIEYKVAKNGKNITSASPIGGANLAGMSELSHVDGEGRARMVDVSAKKDTERIAVAAGEVQTTLEAVALLSAGAQWAADVLAAARLSGIMGAKRTSELIPLCHPLHLSAVTVGFKFCGNTVLIEATAKTHGPTGVEMEALTAVTVTGLNLNYMLKPVDPLVALDRIRLVEKHGGKSGKWVRSGHDRNFRASDSSIIQLHQQGSRAMPPSGISSK